MLQIKNLTVSLTKDLRAIIEDFTFTLNDGAKAVVIGEEGNGKSTLLKLLYDPALVSGYAEYTGELGTQGVALGYLEQELSDSDKALSVYEYLAAVPGFFDLSPREQAELTRRFGLDADFLFSGQIIATLSGGERVKLRLIKLLILSPEVYLLDEPTNDVDIQTLEWLEGFIRDSDKPVLFVSHDETLIERSANVIIHIEQVRRKTRSRVTVAKMSYRDYMASRSSSLENQTKQANKEREEQDKKIERLTRIERKVRHGLDSVSRQDPHSGQLMKKKMTAVKALERRIEREGEELTRLPDVEEAIFLKFDAAVSLPNGKTALDFRLPELVADGAEGRVLARGVELTVTGPKKVCITGRNGAGKTTLLRRIAALLTARGDITAAYMPQNYEELFSNDKTPVDFLAQSGLKSDVTRAMTFLGSVKYTADEMSHPIAELSGGQRGKLLFLKMILDGANVLVLDEPTRNFSPTSNPVIRDILKAYGGAIISVSHDRKYISEVCDTAYELGEDGLTEITI
jgi:ATPase subunit of ABC transporter with duplicated ATPase domains